MAPRKQSRAPPPARLPAGLLLTDVCRRSWRLGATVGAGGFGAIYTATAESASAPSSTTGGYVIKLEPHENGPLFSEMHCYHRVARAETIAAWQKQRKLLRLGMPRFIASGSVDHAGHKYRFMVMERFGSDLQCILDKHLNRLPVPTILYIGLQVLDVLEYLHSQEYVHGDVKAQNLLLGLGAENQIYLVDFGLACRYSVDGRHKPFKPDKKKAHDGTIEFTSRDAHAGVQSRRADLEVLGYNLLQWAAGRLPWQDHLSKPEEVARRKGRAMEDLGGLMRNCFPAGTPIGVDAIRQYLSAVAALGFEETPNYSVLSNILLEGLKSLGCSAKPQLKFTDESAGTSKYRDRSPLSPIQTQEPETATRKPASRKPTRGRRREPEPVAEDEDDEDTEEVAPVRQGRGKNAPRRTKTAAEKKQTEASLAPSSASTSTTSSIYDNITPSMRAVLERRAASQAEKPSSRRARATKASAATRRPATGRSHRSAVASAALSDGEDSQTESFYTPPTSVKQRRSGRLAAASPAASGAVRGRNGAHTPTPRGREYATAARGTDPDGGWMPSSGGSDGIGSYVTARRALRSPTATPGAHRWAFRNGDGNSLSPELI